MYNKLTRFKKYLIRYNKVGVIQQKNKLKNETNIAFLVAILIIFCYTGILFTSFLMPIYHLLNSL